MAITGVKGVPTVADRTLLNRMNSHAQAVQLGDKVFSAKQSMVGRYSYAVQGGSTANVIYLDDSKGSDLRLPANFIITNVLIDRVTGLNSASLSAGTFALGVNSTADILAALEKSSFDGTGFLAGIPVGTAATAILVTAESRVALTNTTPIAQGKFYVTIEGYQGRSF